MNKNIIIVGHIGISVILTIIFVFLVLFAGQRPEVRYRAGELVYNQETDCYECPLDAVVSITDHSGQPIPQKDWQRVLAGRYRPVPISEEER